MIILGNTLIALGKVIAFIISFANLLVIAAVIMSWVSADPRNPLVQFVKAVTDPIFNKIRRHVKPIGMLDLSPIILLIILLAIDQIVANSLIQYGVEMLKSV